jgi:LuxR family maltose regulon positive regulatory protein
MGVLHPGYLADRRTIGEAHPVPEMTSTPSSPERAWQGIPLLVTKLHVPPPRPNLVARPRLLAALDEELHSHLILVSAPAGFGKTTLLSQWIATRGVRCGWLSLDQADNDPIRFCTYVIAALQRIVPGVGQATKEWLHAPQPPPVESILTLLINDLYALPEDVALVLDDYHVIDAGAVHRAVTYLLDQCPPPLHVVIATRADPLLPLARWRARGQMVEVRADDLRFTSDEVALFCDQMTDARLAEGDLLALETRTEGWAVGLQMAALSMQGREDAGSFIRSFSGSHRYVLDYLVEEVLGRQPDEVQAFLLRTSVLERLCGSLCDAVTGQDGSQATLEHLERDNLFVVPLDDERRWYRYHHLFAELLRARLQQAEPDSLPHLHMCAAEWYERNGQVVEAVGHALAARDFGRAVPLIERSAIELLSRGEMVTLLSWARALPEEIVSSRPSLCVICAWTLAFAGRLDETEPLLRAAEERLQRDEPTPGTRGLLGQVAAIRAAAANTRGEARRAIELGCLALELLPPGLARARGVVLSTLGHAYIGRGDLRRAEEACQEFAEIGETLDQVWTLVQAKCELAEVRKIRGQLGQAAELYREALEQVAAKGQQGLGTVGMVAVGLGDLLCERNDLEAAQRQAEDGIGHMPWTAHMRWWENPNSLASGYVTLARILQAHGRLDEARDAIQRATELSHNYDVQPGIRASIAACQVRLWLATGDLTAAVHWVKQNRLTAGDALDPACELAHVSLARVLLATDRPDEAERLLARLAAAAEAGERYGRLIEILALKAIALRAVGDHAGPMRALERALRIGEPEGFVRTFVDEGEPMAALLSAYYARGPAVGRGYVEMLLAALGAAPGSGREGGPSAMLEPLTERELEVLHLVAEGLSNKEIAEQLIIAIGTVKAHVHHIYGKLEVSGRVQALVRARERDLI